MDPNVQSKMTISKLLRVIELDEKSFIGNFTYLLSYLHGPHNTGIYLSNGLEWYRMIPCMRIIENSITFIINITDQPPTHPSIHPSIRNVIVVVAAAIADVAVKKGNFVSITRTVLFVIFLFSAFFSFCSSYVSVYCPAYHGSCH